MVRSIVLLLLLGVLLVPSPAPACPYCSEVLASAADEGDDPYREARAYNNSILFMLSMPYLLVGVVGFLIYREVRAAKRKQLSEASSPTG